MAFRIEAADSDEVPEDLDSLESLVCLLLCLFFFSGVGGVVMEAAAADGLTSCSSSFAVAVAAPGTFAAHNTQTFVGSRG